MPLHMDSLWFILSLASAFLMATNAAFMKRFFSDVSSWEMSIIPFLYATPLCIFALFFVEIPPIADKFYYSMAWVLPLTMIAIILHFRAIHISPLSLTMPFLSFTPVFVLLTGKLLLNETLSKWGVIGMLLVVTGGYVLNIDSAQSGLLGPIKAIFRERGSAIMLLVSAMYAFCSVGGKVLILNSSPMFAAMTLFGLYGPLLALVLIASGKASLRNLIKKPKLGMIVGTLIFTEIICHNLAISMVAAAYMITIKRMAGLFSVGYGWFLFHERGIKYRLIGTIIMTAGAACIAILA